MELYTQYINNWQEVEWARANLEKKTKKELIDVIMRLAEDMEDRTVALDDLRFQRLIDRNWWF